MGNIDLRNPRTLGIVALAVVALIVGLIAYNAGLASGLAQTAGPVTRGVGPGVGGWHGGGFGFFGFIGFLFKLFFFFIIVSLILKFFFGRGPFARGPWGRGPWGGGPAEWQARREEKMREWDDFQEWRKARAASEGATQPAPRQDPPSSGNAVA